MMLDSSRNVGKGTKSHILKILKFVKKGETPLDDQNIAAHFLDFHPRARWIRREKKSTVVLSEEGEQEQKQEQEQEELQLSTSFAENMSNNSVYMEIKEINQQIAGTRKLIEDYDESLLRTQQHHSQVTKAESKFYEACYSEISKLKEKLAVLLLKGGEARVMEEDGTIAKVLDVGPGGEIILCHIRREGGGRKRPEKKKHARKKISLKLKSKSKTDLKSEHVNDNENYEGHLAVVSSFSSNCEFFTYILLDKGPPPLYEIREASNIFFIEDLQIIREWNAEFRKSGVFTSKSSMALGYDGFIMEWKNGIKHKYMGCELGEIIEVITTQMSKYKQSISYFISYLQNLFRSKMESFDHDDRKHVELLEQLWKSIYPEEKLSGTKSPQWKKLGFQGEDPSTDFRAMGMLALHLLVYFAQHHTENFRRLLDLEREYPISTSGVNILNLMLDLLGLPKDSSAFVPVQDFPRETPMIRFMALARTFSGNHNVFEELFCHFFSILDFFWVKMKASYMDYPKVLQKSRDLVEAVLLLRPLSLGDFEALISKRCKYAPC